MHDFLTGVWSLRYVLLFVAFLTATAFALEYRRKWHDAAGLLKVYVDELRIADRYGKTLEERLAKAAESVVDDMLDADDPVFEQGYVFDRQPDWLRGLKIPGTVREPRRVPR